MIAKSLCLLVICSFIYQGNSAPDACSCTRWVDRDMPGGMGDYEVTDATDNPTKPCPIYYVQARKYGNTSILYNSAEEIKTVLNQTVHFVCNRFQLLGVGMYCVNSENTANGGCLDYQVRFCCACPL